MKKSILGKNIKVTMVNEEAKPKGLTDTEKVQKESGKFNDDAMKAYTKLADLYDFDNGDEDALENPPKYTRDEDLDGYEVAAKGAGKMQGLRYDNEGTDVYDAFEERVDALNDTSEYDKNFGTHDGFGEGEKDNVYDELKKAGQEYKKYKYGEEKYKESEDEYIETPRVRTTVKENKTMKRLNFKQSFNGEKHMMSLIKEDYKVDGNIFLMTDGNETYKVRWEGDNTLGEGVVLQYQNRERIDEDKENMKKLFNYKQSDVVGKTNNYINESIQFKKMMDVLKGKTTINEQEEKKTKLSPKAQDFCNRNPNKCSYGLPVVTKTSGGDEIMLLGKLYGLKMDDQNIDFNIYLAQVQDKSGESRYDDKLLYKHGNQFLALDDSRIKKLFNPDQIDLINGTLNRVSEVEPWRELAKIG
jgi:hypothetical protein